MRKAETLPFLRYERFLMLQEKRLYHISMVWYNTYGFISTHKVDRRLLNGNRKQHDERGYPCNWESKMEMIL